MQTFSLEKVLARAEPELVPAGFKSFDEPSRRIFVRAAWAVAELEGAAPGEVQDALGRLATLAGLSPTGPDWGPGRADRQKTLDELAACKDAALARSIYAAVFVASMCDGALMRAEEAFLDDAAKALSIDAAARASLDERLRAIFYEQVLGAALKDGDVSAGERRILNATRKLLGVSEETAARLEKELRAAREK